MYEILATLQRDSPLHLSDVVIIPPNEYYCVSDEDRANQDDGSKNVNTIRKEILNQKDELVVHRNQDDDYGNGLKS